jgi:BASS family bile acid:Na+ symporter
VGFASPLLVEALLPLVPALERALSAVLDAPRDVRRELKRPKWLVLAVIAQFTFMPLIAFGLVQVFDIPPTVAIGLIILGIAWGGYSPL